MIEAASETKTQIRKKDHTVKNIKFMIVAAASTLLAAASLNAAEPKTYQVTGPVLELTPTVITVQKNTEKWELARDKNTKVTGDLKVGSKVTIVYKMIAEEVEVKDAKAKK
jgi:hypothetical protein